MWLFVVLGRNLKIVEQYCVEIGGCAIGVVVIQVLKDENSWSFILWLVTQNSVAIEIIENC